MELELNTKGVDYFVGDIHGMYDTFMNAFNKIGFNKETDRLISVGDLVDRGDQNLACIALLDEPWFYAVLGNHEDMAIKFYNNNWPMNNYLYNGGEWFTNLSSISKKEIVEKFEKLPKYITVPCSDGRMIGVLHADTYALDSWKNISDFSQYDDIIWGRKKYNYRDILDILDIDAVVVGHTIVKQPMVLGNVVYLDTGSYYYEKITIMSSEQVLELV